MARSVASWAGHALALDVRSLAAFRIALGAVVLADALLRTRDVTLMLAPDGMFPLAVLRDFFGDRWAWSLAFLVDATWWGAAILALEGLAGAALAAGVRTRVATVAAWVAVVSIVRRTAPATNAGDEWLACLLFWSMFLPLGATWSIDAARRPRPPTGPTVCSPATAALLLQIAAVYLGAGISKCNPSWWSGSAVSSALSLHDHGTAWGEALSHHPEACRLLGWALLGLELVGPCVLLATSRAGVRGALVATFLGFHAATAVLMTLGLFAYVGMAAWLVVLPSAWWDRCLERARRAGRSGPPSSGSPPTPVLRPAPTVATAIVGAALVVAGIAFAHANTAWRRAPLPAPLQAAVRATCLSQDWGMFGEVPDQRQWVYGRGTLADGRQVDVLRDGRPLEETLPAGGYTSLPHHRWHKIFWELPKPARRIFSPSIAAALAHDWNRRHPEDQRLVALDIRAVRLQGDAASGTRHELLLASWPPRDAAGTGGLDRWIERHDTR